MSNIEETVDVDVEHVTVRVSKSSEDNDALLSTEELRSRREARKPVIAHLPLGTVTLDDGLILPLFDVGDRIVAERQASCLVGNPWLDTRVYIVRSIDDEAGYVDCYEEEAMSRSVIGFRHPHTNIRLAPRRGNPFAVNAAKRELKREALQKNRGVKKDAGGTVVDSSKPRGRGRPKGVKNRDKETIKADKQAKKESLSSLKRERQTNKKVMK